jgi:hypothetical protein
MAGVTVYASAPTCIWVNAELIGSSNGINYTLSGGTSTTFDASTQLASYGPITTLTNVKYQDFGKSAGNSYYYFLDATDDATGSRLTGYPHRYGPFTVGTNKFNSYNGSSLVPGAKPKVYTSGGFATSRAVWVNTTAGSTPTWSGVA